MDELEKILNGYSWIKTKKFDDKLRGDDDVDVMYKGLQEHHKEETEFLIKKVRELAKKLIEIRDHSNKEWKKANNGKRFSTIGKYHNGRESALSEILDIINDEDNN